MRAAQLNRRVAIQRRQDGQDEAGQPVHIWTTVATVWSSQVGDTGLATIRASADLPAPIKRYSFRIRYREDVDEGMRVMRLKNGQPDGLPFDIKAVRMDFAGREWTDLVCEQGSPDGG